MLIINIIFILLLLTIMMIDIISFTIPNVLIVFLTLIGIISYFLHHNLLYFFGSIIGFSIFLSLYLLFPKGIGFGDVKLAGAIGLFLGFRLTILAVLLSFFSGAIVGLLLIALGKKTMKDPIPFGPFLAFGAIFSMFFGEYIIDWYLNLFI